LFDVDVEADSLRVLMKVSEEFCFSGAVHSPWGGWPEFLAFLRAKVRYTMRLLDTVLV